MFCPKVVFGFTQALRRFSAEPKWYLSDGVTHGCGSKDRNSPVRWPFKCDAAHAHIEQIQTGHLFFVVVVNVERHNFNDQLVSWICTSQTFGGRFKRDLSFINKTSLSAVVLDRYDLKWILRNFYPSLWYFQCLLSWGLVHVIVQLIKEMQPVQFSFYFAVVATCSHRQPIFLSFKPITYVWHFASGSLSLGENWGQFNKTLTSVI